LYVGGWGAIPEQLAELAESIRAQPSEIDSMVSLAKQYLGIQVEQELDIFAVGRCYRPLATFDHPIITNVDWTLLGMHGNTQEMPLSSRQEGTPADCQYSPGGLFLNTAHYGDGVTLSLGSGRVMSELLLGLPPSIDISGLRLS
jgi:glycine/D-amino acid oxidase-like deaminating enzyme